MEPIIQRAGRGEQGYNAIELMVVVVIVGILSLIAVPIYAKYVRSSRITEATGRMSELLEAAKVYAIANESNGNPDDADWPTSCNDSGFMGNCQDSSYFTYSLSGQRNGTLTITATGKPGTPMASTKLLLGITNPRSGASIIISGNG